MNKDLSIKSEYERNEVDLKRVETVMEIRRQKAILERDFKNILQQFKILNDSET